MTTAGPLRILAAVAALLGGATAAARDFKAEGADTGAGLGPRWIAQAGTGVASADDVYAIHANTAGLAAVDGFSLSVARQLDATLHAYNFIGAAWRLPLPQDWGWRMTAAAAFYPRIHARASGTYTEADFESLFLRFLLPGVAGTFDGDIDSKTKTYRVGFGASPGDASPWSFGVYADRIDCRSNFCGVHARSNGYTVHSTGARAHAFGAGLRWRASDDLTLGLSLSDANTRLDIATITTDAAGTRTSTSSARFPRKLALGIAWRSSAATRWALDYDNTRGRYGDTRIDLQMLRGGVERRAETAAGAWSWRAGLLAPLRIRSSDSGSLRLPWPVAPTVGLGWRQGPLIIDFALYAHAVMSMHKDRPSPSADLSLGLAF